MLVRGPCPRRTPMPSTGQVRWAGFTGPTGPHRGALRLPGTTLGVLWFPPEEVGPVWSVCRQAGTVRSRLSSRRDEEACPLGPYL